MNKKKLENLFEFLVKTFIPTISKISVISKYSEIESLSKLKNLKKYEYFYLNKFNIHNILYETENIVKVHSNVEEENFTKLFYLILLIKDQECYTNYIYPVEYIKNANNMRKKIQNENALKSFILSMIIMELINNYKTSDDYYDEKYENELNEIYEENKKIRDEKNLLKQYNFDFDLSNEEIKHTNLEAIYAKIIISLLKEEKLEDNEFSEKVFTELNLEEINITEKIFKELLIIFNRNEKYIQKYTITKIEDLYNEQNIKFYKNLFKFVFKNKFYIYNIPFLLKARNTLLKAIKNESFDSSKLDKNENFIFVIKTFFDSSYFDKYIVFKNKKLDEKKNEDIKRNINYQIIDSDETFNDNLENSESNNNESDLSKGLEGIKEENNSTVECDKGKKNKIIYKPINDDTIYNQNNKSNNKNDAESNTTIIYNSELQKEFVYFNDSDFYLLDYIDKIGKHKRSADFLLEASNGCYISGGQDSDLFIYNNNFHKLNEIQSKEMITNISELVNVVKNEITKKEIDLIACNSANISLLSLNEAKLEPKVKKINMFDMHPTDCIEIKKNKHIIVTKNGLYQITDMFSKIISTKSNFINKGIYKNGIKINKKMIAVTSNSILTGGENKISFYNFLSQKIVKEIKGYSFVTSPNGLTLMSGEKDPYEKNEDKTLLCACKKYKTGQKNGILVVNNESLQEFFYNTGNFEVNCFCPLFRKKNNNNLIFFRDEKLIETDYFLVGGYYKKKGKGIIKLFKLNRNQNNRNTIEFVQDICIKKKKSFNGFNYPISCIKQSTQNGKIIASCLDGSVYLFSEPNLEVYLKYDELTKCKHMEIVAENEPQEIIVGIE